MRRTISPESAPMPMTDPLPVAAADRRCRRPHGDRGERAGGEAPNPTAVATNTLPPSLSPSGRRPWRAERLVVREDRLL